MGTVLRRAFIVVLAVVALSLGALLRQRSLHGDRVVARQEHSDGRGSLVLLSRTFTLDRIYQSMHGPNGNQAALRLVGGGGPELLWLTGVRAALVDRDGATPISREFFCHSNLTFTPGRIAPRRTDGRTFTPSPDARLFTLVPGRLGVALPAGFGLPIYSDEPLDYFSMSLNLNVTDRTQRARVRTTVDFVRGSSPAARAIKPLFRRSVYGYEPLAANNTPDAMCHNLAHPGAACGPAMGMSASDAFVLSVGKTNTIHWLIPPGPYEQRVDVTAQLAMPYDTTAHYVTGHLHPYGKSLELIDKTAGRSVFVITSKDFDDRLGVAEMDEIASADGVALAAGHTYELVTRYDNPTARPIDAMSILYVYALDKQFKSPGAASPPAAQVALRN